MKRLTIPCDFKGAKASFHFYVGEPNPSYHPLHYQTQWLNEQRGGIIAAEVMDSFWKLQGIAFKNFVSFEELCVYALDEASAKQAAQGKQAPGPAPSGPASKPAAKAPRFSGIAGSYDRPSFEETVGACVKLAKTIWPAQDDVALAIRLFFLGIALYLRSLPDKKVPTLSEVYRTVVRDDVSYAMAVVLDTEGRFLPPLSFSLIAMYLSYPQRLQHDVRVRALEGLLSFALSDSKPDEFTAFRKDLRHWLIDPEESIFEACRKGDAAKARAALERVQNINDKDRFGWPALNWAAHSGQFPVVELLLERGAEIRPEVLSIAAGSGNADMVSLLIAKGASLQSTDEEGERPLHMAAKRNHIKVVQLLLDKGADARATNKAGVPAANLAAERGYAEIAKLLAEKG